MSKNSLPGTSWYQGRVQVADLSTRGGVTQNEQCKENGLEHFHGK